MATQNSEFTEHLIEIIESIIMAKIFINGLYFDQETNKGITVNLYDNQSDDNSNGNLIFTGDADIDGIVNGEIENKFIGKRIILKIIKPGFIPFNSDIKVNELGVFFTVKLEFDRNYSGNYSVISSISEWNSFEIFNKSQTELVTVIRNFKFQNYGIKYAHYIISLISIIIGLVAIFPYNLISSISFFIIAELLCPYVIGLKPFWKRRAN